jgi:F-box-like
MLPEDVLLEIFDSYRQTFEQEPGYEWVWNGKDGWFNLAHVCQKWRCVVFSSSSRLRVRLLFVSRRAPRANVLARLPPLPIVVDYGSTTLQTMKEQNRAVAALRFPDRVRRIVLKVSNPVLDGIHRAIKRPFPSLECFELLYESMSGPKFDLPTTIFRGCAPSLRHLRLQNVRLASLSPLLSSTKGLVDLNLEVDNVVCPSPAASLLTHLQGMPCLRRLQLRLPISSPVPPTRVPDIVRLLRLTHFQFSGSRRCLEALAAGIAAPFLQDLNIQFQDDPSTVFRLQHLSRFIRDIEGLFFAVLVESMLSGHRISMLTHSHFPDEPPRRITVEDLVGSFVWSGPATLYARLTTVEQLFFHDQYRYPYQESLLCGHGHANSWREFFEQLRNVKILRVQRNAMLDVAQFLSQNGGEPPSHLLPALEEIELRSAVPNGARISDKEREDVHSAFDPFITARQQAGCPVRIYWNAELALPSPYW